jgi:hypothetical protein
MANFFNPQCDVCGCEPDCRCDTSLCDLGVESLTISCVKTGPLYDMVSVIEGYPVQNYELFRAYTSGWETVGDFTVQLEVSMRWDIEGGGLDIREGIGNTSGFPRFTCNILIEQIFRYTHVPSGLTGRYSVKHGYRTICSGAPYVELMHTYVNDTEDGQNIAAENLETTFDVAITLLPDCECPRECWIRCTLEPYLPKDSMPVGVPSYLRYLIQSSHPIVSATIAGATTQPVKDQYGYARQEYIVEIPDYFQQPSWELVVTNSCGKTCRYIDYPPCKCVGADPGVCSSYFGDPSRGPIGTQPNVRVTIGGIGDLTTLCPVGCGFFNGEYILSRLFTLNLTQNFTCGYQTETLTLNINYGITNRPDVSGNSNWSALVTIYLTSPRLGGTCPGHLYAYATAPIPGVAPYIYDGCEDNFARADCAELMQLRFPPGSKPGLLTGPFDFFWGPYSLNVLDPSGNPLVAALSSSNNPED